MKSKGVRAAAKKRPKRGRPFSPNGPRENREFRCGAHEWELICQAAERDDIAPSTWLREQALAAARRVLAHE